MDHFPYRDGRLYCEEIPVTTLAEKYGTPLYIYSQNAITDTLTSLQTEFAEVDPLVCYSVKANSNLGILKVMAARKTLFGAWEGNWLAFNTAHDVKLPGAGYKDPLPFLMYPQAEDKSGLVDPLDADAFKYKITARELKG